MQARKQLKQTGSVVLCLWLLLYLSGCQGPAGQTKQAAPTAQHAAPSSLALHIPAKPVTPTVAPTPTAQTQQPQVQPGGDNGRPVLAFYYTWYNSSSWCSCKMSDLPTIQYNSADSDTIDRQLNWAAGAGISGFISSWWGPGDPTDQNFARLLERSQALENATHYHFSSSIYFESDAPNLNGTDAIVNALRYLIDNYSSNPYFFHWQGKPVLFFWDPLGGGRTLDQWAGIRSQVDPGNQAIWSAEGTDTNILSVFDGIHLFSAGYWGIQNNTMATVDQGFRTKIDTYNRDHQSHKIWAAGVAPGFDDSRVPGRTNPVVVARNNGATYTTSWQAAIGSTPEWITITSFNEWFEGSMIEPSASYNMQYLTLTGQFTQQWRAS